MKYLGIDFGLKHLGISLAEGPLAQPLSQITYQSFSQAINALNKLCQDHQIKAIVIGLPEGKLASKVKIFAKKITLANNLPVYFQDETLTTKEAQLKLLAANAPLKKRKLDHQAAATLILQAYLDESDSN